MSYNKNEKLIVRNELLIGYVFFLIFLSITLMFNFLYWVLEKENIIRSGLLVQTYVNIGMTFLSFVVFYGLTYKTFKDLSNQRRTLKITNLTKKEIVKHTNIDDITGIRTIIGYKYYFVFENLRYEVNKLQFDEFEENELIEIHYAKETKLLLGFYKIFKK